MDTENTEKRYAIRITTDSEITMVEIPHEEWGNIKYERLSAEVGGLIEHVWCWDDAPMKDVQDYNHFDIWINEEGLLEQLPLNEIVSVAVNPRGNWMNGSPIVGNAFITDWDDEGHTIALTEDKARRIARCFELVAEAIERAKAGANK